MAFRTLRYLIPLFLWAICTVAQSVDVKATPFKNVPSRIFYFDDTTVVLYHDPVEWNIWRSNNEGKDWEKIEALSGKALMLIPHPYDNRYAFVLTRDKVHFRTTDRAETWQLFEMPLAPALVSSPLSFHADKNKYGYILYQGSKCDGPLGWGPCHDETYVTEEAFGDKPKLLLSNTSQCSWAHATRVVKDAPEKLIFCVAFDTSSQGTQSISNSRLYSSQDYFDKDITVVDFGLGKQGRGVVALGVVSKFMVAALKDLSHQSGEMMLYVSVDAKNWAKAHFPHATSSKLHENAYTIVESTTHSLAIDVLLQNSAAVGTLFVSNSNGTFFVESLKDTNRNNAGYVDFEQLVGIEGVGIANIVSNAQDVERMNIPKKLRSRITYDDGSSWAPIPAPSHNKDGKKYDCDTSDMQKCSLHLYSITAPHNFGRVFSSRAPGFVMGVGSVGDHLLPYEDCDTFLSIDAGVTWTVVHKDAHIYEFGDQGSVLVIVDDEDFTDHITYSFDDGKTWHKQNLPVTIRAKSLTTIPDSTSLKMLLFGQLAKKSQENSMRYATVFIDFATLNKRKCTDNDFEKWYARPAKGKECLMGHKQWYRRRKADADCFVGDKFTDPIEHEDNCPCTDEDYECDYNYVRQEGKCVSVGPEPIPAGVCAQDRKGKYMGSSGYRLIPGNTCKRPSSGAKDEKVQKDCEKAQAPEGQVAHQTFNFPGRMVQYVYFRNSHTVLVQIQGGQIWQSANEGYTWTQIHSEENFLAIYMNTYWDGRAYLITNTNKIYMTTDTGQTWIPMNVPLEPNIFGYPVLNFHPLQTDWLIWTGSSGCTSTSNSGDCKSIAYYSTTHGRSWTEFEQYVRQCNWARDKELKIDARQIICESYRDKKGNQMMFGSGNPIQLISGKNFYKDKRKLFNSVVGFAKFSEYLLVAEVADGANALDLQVSLDGQNFAQGLFPPNMRLDNHAYTILESSTDSVFLHVTMSQVRGAEWGNLLKSNSNGTYYGLSLQYVNRNDRGYVDFEKVIGLDGIAVMNVVANTERAAVTGKKELQTRITHNDGGTWKPMTPPAKDSLGQKYECSGAECALHIHGYTERIDARTTYSSPSAIGLMMAVGSVGRSLAPYTESDTFFSRDGGFTWEEVHKDAHVFEFGDSGSVLVMANDEGPTDRIVYSLDEGLTWHDYVFVGGTGSGIDGKIRVIEIVTVPKDISRKFILFGYYPSQPSKLVAVHLDFSALTFRQCVLDPNHPDKDDFELWSPSEEREERCLFGRQTIYHRRKRDHNCFIGELSKPPERIVKDCECAMSDMECEFNHARNAAGECVLVEGATPLASDDSCPGDEEFWYERTAYRKIPYSTCKGGSRPDHGNQHFCPGLRGRSSFFWWTIIMLPFAFTALVGYWYYKKGGFQRGAIRLPEANGRTSFSDDSGPLDTLASIPWFLLGVAAAGYGWLSRLQIPYLTDQLDSRRGYRTVAVDEDAQVLRFEDED